MIFSRRCSCSRYFGNQVTNTVQKLSKNLDQKKTLPWIFLVFFSLFQHCKVEDEQFFQNMTDGNCFFVWTGPKCGAYRRRLHIVGLSGKNPPEIKFEESVKLSNFTYVCNTFAKFLTFLIYSKPKYWELVGKFMKSHQTIWIYFWRVLSIWNHCDTGSRRYAWEFGNKPHLSNCSTLTCSQRNLSHAFFLSNRCVYQTKWVEINSEGVDIF